MLHIFSYYNKLCLILPPTSVRYPENNLHQFLKSEDSGTYSIKWKKERVVTGLDFILLRVTKLARAVSTAYWRMKWGMEGIEIWDTECLKIYAMWKRDKEEIPVVLISIFLFSLFFYFSCHKSKSQHFALFPCLMLWYFIDEIDYFNFVFFPSFPGLGIGFIIIILDLVPSLLFLSHSS